MVVWTRGAAVLMAALCVASVSSATTVLVDFEGDALGNVANGFTSVASTGISFSDTVDDDLLIGSDPFITGGSNALASFFGDSGGGIRIDLDFLATSISLDFGNDDPARLLLGSDVFELVAFLGTEMVGTPVFVSPNLNLVVDQTITFDQTTFDAVEVRFTGLLGGTEVIDNVLVTSIPEPTAALLFGIGALVLHTSVGPGRKGPVAMRRSS